MMVTDTAAQGKREARRAVMDPWRARCRAAGVTQDAIAAEYGCTRPFVVNVFGGRAKPPGKFLEVLIRLCKAGERRKPRSA